VFIWQPHSIERSLSFEKQFSESLNDADIVLIPNIYSPLREQSIFKDKLSDEDFVTYLKDSNPKKDIRYTKDFKNTVKELSEFNNNYIFIFASAGDLKSIFKLMDIENE